MKEEIIEEIIERLQGYYKVKRDLAREEYKTKRNLPMANVWRKEAKQIKKEIEYLKTIGD